MRRGAPRARAPAARGLGQPATEDQHAEPAHAAGVHEPGERGPERERVLEGGAGAAQVGVGQVGRAHPGEELRLRGLADGIRPARGGRTDGGQVHGGGEILAADVAERIRANRVAGERPEGAVGVGGAVEVRRLGGVVHEDHQAAGQVARGVHEPGVQGEADLGDLAIAQDHTLRGEALREGRRAGLGLEPGEVALRRSSVTRSSRRPPSRPTTRWTGSASRTSFATSAPAPTASALVADRLRQGSRQARRQPGAPGGSSMRAGSTSTGWYRMASNRGDPRSRSPPRSPAASAPVPAPGSVTVNGDGRPSASHACSSSRPIAAPKIGWASGAVRKSAPAVPGPGCGRR